jgi:uncharacterized protein (TIGR02301 family)
MRLAALLSILVLALAAPLAMAQERAPAERQVLLDLAYTLGEAHALRQACEGEGDQYWRDRMARLIEVEAADEGFTAQLQGKFNAGYNGRQAEFPTCTPESRKALAATAQHGQGLADKMSQVTHSVHPKASDDPGAAPPEPNADAGAAPH